MESNREEAERCVKIARAALEAGDLPRARKFLLIAQRLRPDDQEVEQLLSDLQNSQSSPASASRSAADCAEEDEPTPSSTTTNGTTNTEPTREQVQVVARIIRTVDYYEILGLAKGCSEDEIRKAYRKLSLKVHPDKNKAPKAEEAFKLVSKAFQCLSSAELRERYDVYGPDDARLQYRGNGNGNMRRRYQQQGGGFDFFDEGFDPDEIFQAFFFGGQGQGNRAGFRRQPFVRTPQAGNAAAGGSNLHFGGLIHLLVIFVVILLTSLPSSQPPREYSLHRHSGYAYEKTTSVRGVPYYVRSSGFDDDHPPGSASRQQFERIVEGEYREILTQNCKSELNLRYWGHTYDTPHCRQLEKFDTIHRQKQQQAQAQQQSAY